MPELHTGLTVIDRLMQAASTLNRLPEDKLRGLHGSWPDVVRERVESYGYHRPNIKIPPTARAITAMQQAMAWLLWIGQTERRIVWGRAEGKRWDRLAGENRLEQPEAEFLCRAGLIEIACRLNSGHAYEAQVLRKVASTPAECF